VAAALFLGEAALPLPALPNQIILRERLELRGKTCEKYENGLRTEKCQKKMDNAS
jgi:hypothetical protein